MSNTNAPEFSTPSLLRRFAAMVYDTLLITAISILYGAVMAGLNIAINGAPKVGERINWGVFDVVFFVGWILTIGVFFCYFWHKSGQTLGMKTWRMKITNKDDLNPPDYRKCIIRFFCAPISLVLLGAGYWYMYTNPERQTLHDKISKTRTLLLSKEKRN